MITNPGIYNAESWLSLDFESTNLEKGSALDPANTLLLACWSLGRDHSSYKHGGDHAVWADEYGQHLLSEHIAQASFIVAHNFGFEAKWLARCGVDLRKILGWDTLLAEKVIAGNLKKPLSLDATAARRGLGQKDSTAATLIKAGVCPSTIPTTILEKYCVQDVALTTKIFLQQREELQALGLMPVFLARNLVTPVLADIETHGMGLDKDRVEAVYSDYKERYDALMEEFSRLTGGINLKSPKQMRDLLYVKLGFEEVEDYKGNAIKTDTGESSTGKDIIAQLKAVTPEQKELKKCAVALSLLKTPMQNLTKLLALVNKGERMYGSFNQAVTQTHRLSSSGRKGGMQLQNVDRNFKKCFVAREGYCILEADAAQLEFRVAADLARDPVAERSIKDGEDIHAFTASILGTTRQAAKAETFKPLYGGNSGTPKQKAYYAAFRKKYSKIYEMQKGWTYEVAKEKKLRVASGLIFYWPDTKIKDGGYVTNTSSIFNFGIQSFATADIIPLILRDIWERIEGLDVKILSTVHDSIILEVSSEVLDGVLEIVISSFTDRIYSILHSLYGYEFKLPLAVAVKAGDHWGEGKEDKYERN